MNKKTRLAILGIIAVILVTIGITYAYWLVTRTQQGTNVISTGCIDINLTNETNDIDLPSQYPISDEEGMALVPYEFTISNTCKNSVNYEVALESIGTEESAISDSAIKAVLNENVPSKYMNKGMLTVGIIMLSLIALLLINVISNYSTGGELDYYLVKETAEAAMEDAVDVEYYRLNSLIRIDKERFVESFLRRFANNVDNTRSYTVEFYDINEVPPKVSIRVNSDTVLSFDGQSAGISTSYDGIIEAEYEEDIYTSNALKDPKDETGKALSDRESGQLAINQS